MPVDHDHSRFGRHGTLGDPVIWNCPACGKLNEGRRAELGCGHCGSGDPTQSTAGKPADWRLVEERAPGPPVLTRPRSTIPAVGPAADPQTRIYRLIEYVIRDAEDIRAVLRRSLVGTIDMGWGTITGTIVDSVDMAQEDRLRMARMQPGIWLANRDAMDRSDPPMTSPVTPRRLRMDREDQMTPTPLPPVDLGPPVLPAYKALAQSFCALIGYRGIHTLALALSNVAQELEGNGESHKFLQPDECLQLANALMQEIPEDWDGDRAPVEPTKIDEQEADRARARERVAAVQSGAIPTAAPWVDPATGKGLL